MKDFLDKYREKYYLSLGEYRFSPIMEASIALSLSYRNLHIKNNQTLPFFLSFPDKNFASVWLSVSLLVNFFLEDYVNQSGELDLGSFKKGNKVEIFNAVAEIVSAFNNKIIIGFSDGVTIEVTKNIRPHINKARRNLINKYSHFANNLIQSKKNRNPISKILEPNDESVIINESCLTSKVLIITGRGNVKKLGSILKASVIYEESLENIFIKNGNLLIKKDLESYKEFFNRSVSDKEKLFKELLLKFLKNTNELDSLIKSSLISSLESGQFLTLKFKEEFDNLVDFYKDSFAELEKIDNLYPGIKDEIPINLKAVVINEIEQVHLYAETINGFLNAGIPVFVIGDRYIQKSGDFTFFTDYFRSNPTAFRINWNRNKIKILNELSVSKAYFLDKKLWSNCLRYSNQKIKVDVCETRKLDTLFYETQKVVKSLVENEMIQQAYYKYLYPAAYLFKNSINSNAVVVELAELFDKELQKNKFFIGRDIYSLMKDTLESLKEVENNSKQIKNINETFSNLLPVSLGKQVFIPFNATRINIPDENSERVFFSGYPYDEFSGKYLNNAVCADFVPEINISCWPIESQLTYNYLKRRIIAGYFTDYLKIDWGLPVNILLNNEQDFESEFSTFVEYKKETLKEDYKENIDQEIDLQNIKNFRYKGFSQTDNSTHSYLVKCDILSFSDGTFMFLPKNSKVLAQIETEDGTVKFKESFFSELEVGFKVFKHQKDRDDFKELAKDNLIVRKAFSELELWKNSLLYLFQINNFNLDQLERKLFEVKFQRSLNGNPVKTNIQRWLFNEEIIAPDIDNIKIIFFATEMPEIDKVIKNLREAYGTVVSYRISLSSKIKKGIATKLAKKLDDFEQSFKINLDKVEIDIESRIITGLEKSDMEIDYHNTRRILS